MRDCPLKQVCRSLLSLLSLISHLPPCPERRLLLLCAPIDLWSGSLFLACGKTTWVQGRETRLVLHRPSGWLISFEIPIVQVLVSVLVAASVAKRAPPYTGLATVCGAVQFFLWIVPQVSSHLIIHMVSSSQGYQGPTISYLLDPCQTHTHTITHIPNIHTHTNTYTLTHQYTHTPSHIHTHHHVNTNIHAHTLPHQDIHTYTITHIPTYTNIDTHSHTKSYTHIITHTITHTNIHTYLHTQSHTHTNIHTLTHTP